MSGTYDEFALSLFIFFLTANSNIYLVVSIRLTKNDRCCGCFEFEKFFSYYCFVIWNIRIEKEKMHIDITLCVLVLTCSIACSLTRSLCGNVCVQCDADDFVRSLLFSFVCYSCSTLSLSIALCLYVSLAFSLSRSISTHINTNTHARARARSMYVIYKRKLPYMDIKWTNTDRVSAEVFGRRGVM